MATTLNNQDLMRARTISAFRAAYGSNPEIIFAAPGRVNLIGEHTDYNEGFVLPAAIDRHVVLAASKRQDRLVRINALDFDEIAEFSLEDLQRQPQMKWSNYQRGVAWALQNAGFALTGLSAVLTSDVPIGSGLSSSAAIELATCCAFQTLSRLQIDGVKRALICQKAENEFVGMRCGIMDQYIISLGQRNHALLIDCRDLSFKLVPLAPEASLVICDTKKRRGLVDSEYNTRRSECEQGAAFFGVRALRDVTPAMFEAREAQLDPTVRRRCRHIINENQRVLDAVKVLQSGDLVRFGSLMKESHISLRDDYQVSCRELDTMVEIAWQQPGVLGARMTGAGFGGCTVNLVQNDYTANFLQQVTREYQDATGLQPEIYVCTADEGVHLIG
jgi:galactokinase